MRGVVPEPLRVLPADGMQGQCPVAQHEQQENGEAQVAGQAAGTAQAEAKGQKQDPRQGQPSLKEQLLPEKAPERVVQTAGRHPDGDMSRDAAGPVSDGGQQQLAVLQIKDRLPVRLRQASADIRQRREAAPVMQGPAPGIQHGQGHAGRLAHTGQQAVDIVVGIQLFAEADPYGHAAFQGRGRHTGRCLRPFPGRGAQGGIEQGIVQQQAAQQDSDPSGHDAANGKP